MKIYISGKITGLNYNDAAEKFDQAERNIERMDKTYIAINPMKISPYSEKKEWSDYMLDCVTALFNCDAIYMLSDWGQSRGARIEYAIAKELDIKIFFE